MQRSTRGLTVEQKMKAMREVQEIYALGKKWRRNLPDEKRPDFEGMADRIMSRALGLPTLQAEPREPVYEAAHMSMQDPRTAALVERTLKNGMYHPDVLHSFQSDRTTHRAEPPRPMRVNTVGLPDPHLFMESAGAMHIHPSHESRGGPDGDHFVPSMHEHDSMQELSMPNVPAQGVITNATPDTHYS
jgi:hypothetical protein